MPLTLSDLSKCVTHAAEGRAQAKAAAQLLLRRLETVPSDTWIGSVTEQLLLRFAAISEEDVEAFERMYHAFQIRLKDGTLVWLAAQAYPPIIPPAPRFSMRGLRALALAVQDQL